VLGVNRSGHRKKPRDVRPWAFRPSMTMIG
jgi:hypothetical protein